MIIRFIAILLAVAATILLSPELKVSREGFDFQKADLFAKVISFAAMPFLVTLVYSVLFSAVFFGGIGFARDRDCPVIIGNVGYVYRTTLVGKIFSFILYMFIFLGIALLICKINDVCAEIVAVVVIVFTLVEHIIFLKVLICPKAIFTK